MGGICHVALLRNTERVGGYPVGDLGNLVLTSVPCELELISRLPPNCLALSRIPQSPTPAPAVCNSVSLSRAIPLPSSITSTWMFPSEIAIRTDAVTLPE